eukprot:354267-Chlamydomonas_euryale.AAC.3
MHVSPRLAMSGQTLPQFGTLDGSVTTRRARSHTQCMPCQLSHFGHTSQPKQEPALHITA